MMTQKEKNQVFILKARKIHGNKYDYSKVNYINSKTKICIICPEHGEFWLRPNDHLTGRKCRKCKYKNHPYKKLSLGEFLSKIIKIHPNLDFSQFLYKQMHTKGIVICPKHGKFLANPCNLLNGHSCPKCRSEKMSQINLKSLELFILQCKEIHNNFYDYRNVIYKGGKYKINIICPIHGTFEQEANAHLSGLNCPKCNLSKLENHILKVLKNANIKFVSLKKFTWLKRQSLDFFLPDYNIGIECQGKLHFIPISIFGGKIGFNKTIKRDENKLKLCKENNIKLLYYANYKYDFPYNVITSDNDLLNEILNSKQN